MIGGVHRTGAAELGGERETVSGAVARIARDGGPGPTSASVLRANGPRPGHARHVPRHGDTGHAHLGPTRPRLPHILAKRTLALRGQRWMCAGCGMKVVFLFLLLLGGAKIL